jgi:hypothetical protein
MYLAERYARRAVGDGETSTGALLLVHDGLLDVVPVVRDEGDAQAVRRIVDRHRAVLAVLIEDPAGAEPERPRDRIAIRGETADGTCERWQYRVWPCGRGRRLTRVSGREASEVAGDGLRLFEAPPARADGIRLAAEG